MEQKKEELKVYKFEVTCLKQCEDGTVLDERQTLAYGYAFEGDPSPRVDYNRYWESGDGCVNLVSKDGAPVDSSVDTALVWMYDQGFRGIAIPKMVDGLEAPGRWAEVCLGDAVKTTLRITRLAELPEIDPKATIRNSDLSMAQQHRIKIDGVPLFPEGGTVKASDPKTPTWVLRPNLGRELGKVWEEFIGLRGVDVNVTVNDAGINTSRKQVSLTIKASSREELNRALGAVGVLHPQDITPDVVDGDGDAATGFTATVILATEV